MTKTNEVRLNAKQVAELAKWLTDKGVGDLCPVRLRQTETGIGPAIEAHVEIAEGEGIWKDLSDYDNW